MREYRLEGNVMKKFIRMIALVLLGGALLLGPAAEVYAGFDVTSLVTKDDGAYINDEDRAAAYAYLVEHMESLKKLYDLSPEGCKRMNEVFYQANVFIAENQMTVGQLVAYVNEVESNLTTAAQSNVKSAEQFLFITNNTGIPTASYGQTVNVGFSVVNLGVALMQDVLITPVVDTDVTKWPFDITTAQEVRKVYRLEPVADVNRSPEFAQPVSWSFRVSKDALTGTYPLKFHAKYYRDGAVEETDLVTYIDIKGAPGSGSLNSNPEKEGKTSTPRIIVTGFRTDPAEVYAGDTFTLTITVQNTASATAVSNIQFDLKAAKEGTGDSAVEAFLPTSGSATIFVKQIPAGGTTDLTIEMTARSDLTQKPYVVELDASYEDEKNNPYQAATSVSIPVKQKARVDTGDAEILPATIQVGATANIMFPVYNKGRTTLYNTTVEFVGDSISGGSSFLGKIEPGATGNVDAMVTGAAPTEDDGTIKALISYEDEAGNVTTIEKELTVYVMMMDYGAEDWGGEWDEGMIEEEKKPFPWGIVIGGAAAIVVAGIVVAIILSKKKKSKKLQEELDAIDDDNDNEE